MVAFGSSQMPVATLTPAQTFHFPHLPVPPDTTWSLLAQSAVKFRHSRLPSRQSDFKLGAYSNLPECWKSRYLAPQALLSSTPSAHSSCPTGINASTLADCPRHYYIIPCLLVAHLATESKVVLRHSVSSRESWRFAYYVLIS